MRINQTKNSPNFRGVYNNKLLLKGLDEISNHSASFVLGASFLGATILKPAVISVTPNVEKENKKVFSAESVASATSKLGIGLLVSIPIENTIKKILRNKKDYFKNGELKNEKFISQVLKMTSNIITAVPKSVLTVALIPVILDLFHKEKKEIKNKTPDTLLNPKTLKNPVFTSFKGNKFAKVLANTMQSKKMQEFALNNIKSEKNITRNASVATDVLLTATSVLSTSKSKKINKEQKKPLILNKVISTGISIFAGCSIDKLVQKLGVGLVEKFKQANINDKKLLKYLEGINVARPTIIFALIYYGLIPMISSYSADKITKIDNQVK